MAGQYFRSISSKTAHRTPHRHRNLINFRSPFLSAYFIVHHTHTHRSFYFFILFTSSPPSLLFLSHAYPYAHARVANIHSWWFLISLMYIFFRPEGFYARVKSSCNRMINDRGRTNAAEAADGSRGRVCPYGRDCDQRSRSFVRTSSIIHAGWHTIVKRSNWTKCYRCACVRIVKNWPLSLPRPLVTSIHLVLVMSTTVLMIIQ